MSPRIEQTTTVDAAAAKGLSFRLKCFACERVRTFPAAKFRAKHGSKIVSELRPRCDNCLRSRRRGPGLDQPGYCTAISIVDGNAPNGPAFT